MNTNSTLDPVIFICKHNKKKPDKMRSKRTHQMKQNITKESKEKSPSHQTNINCDNVIQHIQVEKQEFKCIINLKTAVCTNKSMHRRKHCRKHRTKDSEHRKKGAQISAVYREIPRCTRSACWNRFERNRESRRRCNVHTQSNLHVEGKTLYLGKEEVKHKKQKISNSYHYHRSVNHSTTIYQKKHKRESRILISPLPLLSFEDNLSYEDISSTSLETDVAKPTDRRRKRCYRVRKHKHKGDVHESKLDTLIKRTKERERRLVEESRRDQKTWLTSTPKRNDYTRSSADFPMNSSDMDISFNSKSTLVLGNNNHCNAYSPSSPVMALKSPIKDLHYTNGDQSHALKSPIKELYYTSGDQSHALKSPIKDLHCTNEDLRQIQTETKAVKHETCRGYSSSSPTKIYYKLDRRDNVKTEPTLDIEAYSPTSTFNINCSEDNIKREIVFKNEPIFSCAISPIYFENYTVKVKNVKNEYIDSYFE